MYKRQVQQTVGIPADLSRPDGQHDGDGVRDRGQEHAVHRFCVGKEADARHGQEKAKCINKAQKPVEPDGKYLDHKKADTQAMQRKQQQKYPAQDKTDALWKKILDQGIALHTQAQHCGQAGDTEGQIEAFPAPEKVCLLYTSRCV